MITIRQITRVIHAFAISLHVAALRSDKRVTERRAARTVKQTRLVQAAISKRCSELVDENEKQRVLRESTMVVAGCTISAIDRELARYES